MGVQAWMVCERTTELKTHIEQQGERILTTIVNGTYLPSPILAVEIPKANGGTRILGIPTVTDRWLQQAVSQQLAKKRLFRTQADRCPCCKTGTMITVEIIPAARAPPTALLSEKRVEELLLSY